MCIATVNPIFGEGVAQLLLNMINSDIEKQEFISFVQEASLLSGRVRRGLVPQEKADEFIKSMLVKYPMAVFAEEGINPVYEEIVPVDWDDD
ncbi:MAG: hypothetical protein AAGE84_14045 [Cyanobacteria bacterium P01_G01_bin.39]